MPEPVHLNRTYQVDPKVVGRNIARLRKACLYTQEDLAHQIGILRAEQSLISHWENGHKLPSLKRLTAIAYVCGKVSIDRILFEEVPVHA